MKELLDFWHFRLQKL